MSILVNEQTKMICQGLGRAGSFHCSKCVEYGTDLVGAIKPGKGGSSFTISGQAREYPYFHTVADAVASTGANTSLIFRTSASSGRRYNGSSRSRDFSNHLYYRGHSYPGHGARHRLPGR